MAIIITMFTITSTYYTHNKIHRVMHYISNPHSKKQYYAIKDGGEITTLV